MTTLSAPRAASPPCKVEERLRRALQVHLDPDHGTPYWLDRQAAVGIDLRREIRTLDELGVLGDMSPSDLAARPLRDFVPRGLGRDLAGYILGQTGGTTGGGVWTIYRPDEFEEAFITPFAAAAAHAGFPRGERWLYVGPSGPHIIGKVVGALSASMGGHDPFSVDFDARWAKKLPGESLAMQRYLGHVVDQAMAVIGMQEIGVLFTTPAVLGALAAAMTPEQRRRVRGIHYGGMELGRETLERFQRRVFPDAVHLSGYGNSLFGCCLELSVEAGRSPEYFPFGARLILEVVDRTGAPAADGETGTVRFTRLDDSMLIIRMLERDAAARAAVPAGAPQGFVHAGVRGPHSPLSLAPTQAKGLY